MGGKVGQRGAPEGLRNQMLVILAGMGYVSKEVLDENPRRSESSINGKRKVSSAGLEEMVDQAMATVREAMQGPRSMVVIDASIFSQMAGLEEFLKRLPVEGQQFLIVGDNDNPAVRRVTASNPNIRRATGLEEAVQEIIVYSASNRVEVLGPTGFWQRLKEKVAGLVPSIQVSRFDLRFGLRGLAVVLGVAKSVLDQFNWDVIQSTLAGLAEAA